MLCNTVNSLYNDLKCYRMVRQVQQVFPSDHSKNPHSCSISARCFPKDSPIFSV